MVWDISESGRSIFADKKVNADVEDETLDNSMFIRLIAKGKKFTNVSFKYCIFDNCYIRKCTFNSCDFTGAKFIGSNLPGSSFEGCTFDYSSFEKTHVSNEILRLSPSKENLKLMFARSLRINYQQIGDAKSVNMAIRVELDASNTHLYNAWISNDAYYRSHYIGLARLKAFLQWVEFKLLDFVWGNGESLYKMIRAVLITVCIIAFIDVFLATCRDNNKIIDAFITAPAVFLGVSSSANYNKLYLSCITITRLTLIGFFISIIIKRFNRR